MKRLSLVVTLNVMACGADSSVGERHAGAPLARDSAGVRIVENTGADILLEAELIPGAELVPADSALTPVPWGVAADPTTGRIYAADWTGARVAVFDGAGAYGGSFGRAGDGPGEFRRTTAIAMDPGGDVIVWDAGRGILSRWSGGGELREEEGAPVDYWGPGFAVVGRDVVTVTTEQAPSGTVMRQRLIAVTPEGRRDLHEVPVELGLLRLGGATATAPKVFAPSVIWASRGERIYVLKGPEYRIDVLQRGEAVSSFRRAVGPVRVTREMAVAGVESGPGPYRGFMRRAGVTAEEIVAAVGHETEVAAVQAIAVDPEGRLWVTRSDDGVRPGFIDILGHGGGYQGTLEAPGVPVAFLSASEFVGLGLDETGRTALRLYRVRHRAPEAGGGARP